MAALGGIGGTWPPRGVGSVGGGQRWGCGCGGDAGAGGVGGGGGSFEEAVTVAANDGVEIR